MRIALVCFDTRGGVQPYVALGRGLARAGHTVRVLVPSDFADFVREAGLEAAPLTGSVEAFVRSMGASTERGTLASTLAASREIPKRMSTMAREALEACEGFDLLAGGVGGMVLGLAVADRLRVPFVPAHLQPISAPTGRYPGVLLPFVPPLFGALGNRVSHALSEAALWGPFLPAMRLSRRALGVRGSSRALRGQPTLYGFSARVVPVPSDATHERVVTGYWPLEAPEGYAPPEALARFLSLDDPRPVVSVGFGSMASEDPAALTRTVLSAARTAQVRVLLLSGWGGLCALPDEDPRTVHCADALPHEWLFSRVRAVVHHGGAGTTGAALRAGVPAVVVPFTMDQPFWASRVHALRVGPAPIARAKLTEAALARALTEAAHDEALRLRARSLGELLRAEDGVGAAVARLERIAR